MSPCWAALGVQRHTPVRSYRTFDGVAKKGDANVGALPDGVWIYRTGSVAQISKMAGRCVRGLEQVFTRGSVNYLQSR